MQGSSKEQGWYDERVEPFVDGDLAGTDLLAFTDRLETDKDLKEKVQAARRISASLRDLPSLTMPAGMLERVMSQANDVDRQEANGRSPARRLRLVPPARVAWATLAMAATIVFAIILLPQQLAPQESDSVEPSQAEVEKALAEVKWTLALVSDIGNERNEIVNGRIVAPVQKAMSFVITADDATNEIQ